MYQHDMSETKLAKTLDAIVTECVCFVGKFLNHEQLKSGYRDRFLVFKK